MAVVTIEGTIDKIVKKQTVDGKDFYQVNIRSAYPAFNNITGRWQKEWSSVMFFGDRMIKDFEHRWHVEDLVKVVAYKLTSVQDINGTQQRGISFQALQGPMGITMLVRNKTVSANANNMVSKHKESQEMTEEEKEAVKEAVAKKVETVVDDDDDDD